MIFIIPWFRIRHHESTRVWLDGGSGIRQNLMGCQRLVAGQHDRPRIRRDPASQRDM